MVRCSFVGIARQHHIVGFLGRRSGELESHHLIGRERLPIAARDGRRGRRLVLFPDRRGSHRKVQDGDVLVVGDVHLVGAGASALASVGVQELNIVPAARAVVQDRIESLGPFTNVVVEQRHGYAPAGCPHAILQRVVRRNQGQLVAECRIIAPGQCGQVRTRGRSAPAHHHNRDSDSVQHTGSHPGDHNQIGVVAVLRERVGLLAQGDPDHRREDENGRFSVARVVAADTVHGRRETPALDGGLEVPAGDGQFCFCIAGSEGYIVGDLDEPLLHLFKLHRHRQALVQGRLARQRQLQVVHARDDRVALGVQGDARGHHAPVHRLDGPYVPDLRFVGVGQLHSRG